MGGRADHTAAACFVMYQPTAVVRPMSSGAQDVDHRRDAVRRIVVDRPAREPEPTGDGERRAVVGGDAERVAPDLYGRREARVQIEVRDVVEARARGIEHGGTGRGQIAGDAASDHRSVTNQWSWASAAECRNTILSSGTPAARAASYEQSNTAAPWSTSMLAHMRFGYGKHTARLSGEIVRISSGVYATSVTSAFAVRGRNRREPRPQLAHVR